MSLTQCPNQMFAIGDVNMGCHRLGELIVPTECNTMMFTRFGVEPELAELDKDRLVALKAIGSFVVRVAAIVPTPVGRYAELELATANDEAKCRAIFQDVLGVPEELMDDPRMTLTDRSLVEPGWRIGAGYLSVLTQKPGECGVRLSNDYPLTHAQGPRFKHADEGETKGTAKA